jgi:PleD family two-component response regulator
VAMADRETPFESVVAQADEALYRAKAEGRNRVSPA